MLFGCIEFGEDLNGLEEQQNRSTFKLVSVELNHPAYSILRYMSAISTEMLSESSSLLWCMWILYLG